MSVDALARRAGRATRDEVDGSLDVESKLRELHVTRVRRRRTRACAALLVVCAAVVTGIAALPRADEEPPRAARPDQAAVSVRRCPDHPQVRCLDDVVLVRGRTPFTFKVPRGFSHAMDLSEAPHSIVVFKTGSHRGGLTILEDVHAAGRPMTQDAEPLARWVASRTYLKTSPVRHGWLNGFHSWTVRARPSGSRQGAAPCNGVQRVCRAVLEQPSRSGWQTGVWDGMVSRYTFLDVPGLGTVGLWSWTFGADSRFVDDDVLARSIDFNVPS